MDIRRPLWELGKDMVFRNQVPFTNGFARALINDAGDIMGSDFFLRHTCPKISLTAEWVAGFDRAPVSPIRSGCRLPTPIGS